MTLLVVAISTSYANQTTLIDGVTLPDVPTGTLDLSSQEVFTPTSDGWIVMEPNGDVRNNNYTWFNALAWNTTSVTVSDVSSYTAPFNTLSSKSVTTVRKTERTKNIRFTGAETFSVLGSASNNNRVLTVSVYSVTASGDNYVQTLVETKSTNTGSNFEELLFEGLSASTNYVAYFYATINSGNDGNVTLAEIAIKAPTGAVDPTFSLSASSIGTDETAQINVGSKTGLDGITLSDIAYGTSGVVTVNASGVVTPVAAGTTTITFNSSAVADKYNAGSGNLSITVTAPVVKTPTLTAGGTFVGDSKSVEIACETEGAAIVYSTDDGTTWNDYTEALTITETTTVKTKATKSGYTDSEEASETYTKFAKSDLASVSAAATWDFTKITSTLELKDDGTTTPAKSDDYYTLGDIATINGTTIPSGFGDATTIAFKGQYPYRSKKSQAGYWKFNTTVAGTIAVTFSDTGSSGSDPAKRYLNVNGVNTEYYTQRDGSVDKKTAENIVVPAGDVVITSYGEDGETWQAIVVEKIVFTPATTTTVTLNSNGYATYSKATDFVFSGAQAYKMNLNYTGGTLEGTKVTGKIQAGEGILFKGTAGATVTIAETTGASALADNSLVGTTPATGDAPTPDYTSYKYFVLKGKSFVPYTTATTFGAGKAFFQVAKDAQLPASLELVFDGEEATAVEAVAETKANEVAPVKVIKGGKLYIGNYNVAGQQVK